MIKLICDNRARLGRDAEILLRSSGILYYTVAAPSTEEQKELKDNQYPCLRVVQDDASHWHVLSLFGPKEISQSIAAREVALAQRIVQWAPVAHIVVQPVCRNPSFRRTAVMLFARDDEEREAIGDIAARIRKEFSALNPRILWFLED